MSSKVFEHYESEYLSSTRHAAQNIERINELLPGVERDSISKTTLSSLETAEEICAQMDLEARSLTGPAKQQLVAQAKDYQAGIAALRSQLKLAKTSSRAEEQARAELLRGADPALKLEADNQRGRLLDTTDRLNRASDKLKGACQVALETEAVGESIMSDLEAQRHTLQHARGTLRAASQGIDRSKRLLAGMTRRALYNRVRSPPSSARRPADVAHARTCTPARPHMHMRARTASHRIARIHKRASKHPTAADGLSHRGAGRHDLLRRLLQVDLQPGPTHVPRAVPNWQRPPGWRDAAT